ncbi:hypothetical protein PHSC3_001939 [Chlamydiales bacterium STE3]|nr:hypothetical protein PHSC3_001939 [Chlamydiales bacterium STE3]
MDEESLRGISHAFLSSNLPQMNKDPVVFFLQQARASLSSCWQHAMLWCKKALRSPPPFSLSSKVNCQEARLYRHELVVVSLLITTIGLMLVHASFVSANRVHMELDVPSSAVREVVVTVEGAVLKPGRYHFKKGVDIEEIINVVGVQPDADLSKVQFKQTVQKSRKIRVPRGKKKRGNRVQKTL